jgi:hypothetical protein
VAVSDEGPRKPLFPLDDATRAAQLADYGLGLDLLPLNLTDAERQAASALDKPIPPTREERRLALESGYYDWQRPPMDTKPIVSSRLAALAAAAAGVLAFAASAAPNFSFLPGWAAFGLWALAAAAALLAGVALPPFKGTNPAVPQTLVPLFLGMSGGLATLASALADGNLKNVVLFAAVLCSALAGKAMPVPTVPAVVAPKA